MAVTLYRHEFAVCPWCGEESGGRVDHLYDRPNTSFGPWFCEKCSRAFKGVAHAPGDVTITKDEKNTTSWTRQMVLLKFDGKDGPVFFVMDHKRYHTGEPKTEAEHQDSQRYFFEEHSCPTNWLRDCVAVIEDGDTDPHGFLDFVRAVEVPEDFSEHDDEKWALLFPEAFGGETIDGEAVTISGSIAPPR
jgi:ribosomal protein L37AE/L43A